MRHRSTPRQAAKACVPDRERWTTAGFRFVPQGWALPRGGGIALGEHWRRECDCERGRERVDVAVYGVFITCTENPNRKCTENPNRARRRSTPGCRTRCCATTGCR